MTLNNTAKAPAQPSGALRNRIIAAVLLCCIALALSSTLRSNVLFPQLPMLDSSVFQYIGIAMTKGAVPYRDTFDHKGPVIFFLNCFGKLIGDNGVWYFEFLLLLLTTVCVYRTMRKFCGRGVSLIGTAVAQFSLYYYLGGGNYTEEYALPFITWALLIFTDYFLTGETTRIRLAVCGACFMMVALLRANMVATWVVFPVAVLIEELLAKRRRVWGYLLFFLIGAAAAFLPFLIYFAYHHALHDFWAQYGVFNFAYSGAAWSSRVHAMWSFLWNPPAFGAFAICIAGMLCRKEQKLYGLSLVYLLVSLAAIGMSGREYNHYGIILMPLTILPLALAMQFLEKRAQKRPLLLSGVLVVLILFYPWWQTIRGLPTYTPPEQTIEGIISTYVRQHTDEDETIIVCGHKDVFYVLSGRMAASKYSYPLPIAMIEPAIYDEFFEDLHENVPAVIISDTDSEQNQLNYTELNARLEAFLSEYPYGAGKTLEGYTVYVLDEAYRHAGNS